MNNMWAQVRARSSQVLQVSALGLVCGPEGLPLASAVMTAPKEAQSSLKDYSVCSPPQKPSQAGPAERSEALTEDLPAWLVKLKAATSLKNTWKAG